MEETEEMIEVLMVSSPKRDDLVFPKVLDIVCTNNLHRIETFNAEKFHFLFFGRVVGRMMRLS